MNESAHKVSSEREREREIHNFTAKSNKCVSQLNEIETSYHSGHRYSILKPLYL